jgi:hypothetical protein
MRRAMDCTARDAKFLALLLGVTPEIAEAGKVARSRSHSPRSKRPYLDRRIHAKGLRLSVAPKAIESKWAHEFDRLAQLWRGDAA